MMKRVVIVLMAAMLASSAWALEEEDDPYCWCAPVTCPPGAVEEYEGCTGGLNDGCTTELRTLECGTSIYGGLKVTAAFRDTDWYRVVAIGAGTDSVLLAWEVVAEFPVRIAIVRPGPGPDSCASRTTLVGATGPECDTIRVSACVYPGAYWVVVRPAENAPLFACKHYCATVTCSPCRPEPPCPQEPPRLITIGERFCLDYCGNPFTVYWCCPLDGPPVFRHVSGPLFNAMVSNGPDSTNADCPPPGGWWSAVITAEDTGLVCISFDRQLAVEMGTFDAIPGDNRVILRWNTLSESDNDHFDIERDGAVVARPRSLGDSPSGHSYEWVDEHVQNSVAYAYTLYSVDVNGQRRELASASAAPVSGPMTVMEYALHQNYPNPFNPATQITFDLVESGPVTLTIFNPMGQVVNMLVNSSLTAGRHTMAFDAGSLPTGVYLYRLEAGSFTAVRKMLLIK